MEGKRRRLRAGAARDARTFAGRLAPERPGSDEPQHQSPAQRGARILPHHLQSAIHRATAHVSGTGAGINRGMADTIQSMGNLHGSMSFAH